MHIFICFPDYFNLRLIKCLKHSVGQRKHTDLQLVTSVLLLHEGELTSPK